MAERLFKIFLSSTNDDLGPHRAKIRDVLDELEQRAVHMGAFGARPERPMRVCQQEVERCDALIVIVGHRYGWIPSVEDGGDGHKSITWWEVHWALEKGIPVFAFLVDLSAHWVGAKEQDRLLDKDDDPAEVRRAVAGLQAFRAELENNVTRKVFSSVDGLGGTVATSLANWLAQQRSRVLDTSTSRGPAAGVNGMPDQPSWTGSPFPGLRAFTPADEAIFFGRSRETDYLIEQLCSSRCRLLLIHGSSGSGKSSLVAAGLIPRLKQGAIPDSEHWLLPDVERPPRGLSAGQGAASPGYVPWHGLRFTPGELGPDPFLALAAKLAPLLPGARAPRVVADQLRRDERQLATLVEEALSGARAGSQALLFVDQLEELVTIVTDEALQRAFVKALACAARECPRARIVATVRVDFYHRCIEAQPELAEVLREHGVSVPLAVPGAAALVDMIRKPAQRAGLAFEPPSLVEELVQQTVAKPGGLALLALTLDELYRQRTDGQLTEAAYRKFGGLSGVANARAETTFASLSEAARRQLHQVFTHLVLVDEHRVATRARARRADVTVSPEATELTDAFVEARLLVTGRNADNAATVEVAHEALLREWPKLADWITERADDLRLRRQVEAAALEWLRVRSLDATRASSHLWVQERLDPVYAALARLTSTPGAAPPRPSPASTRTRAQSRCGRFSDESPTGCSTNSTMPARRINGGPGLATGVPSLATGGQASGSAQTGRRTLCGARFRQPGTMSKSKATGRFPCRGSRWRSIR